MAWLRALMALVALMALIMALMCVGSYSITPLAGEESKDSGAPCYSLIAAWHLRLTICCMPLAKGREGEGKGRRREGEGKAKSG